ncbi:MAG: DUF167 domain-containing protein [Verrucomicrobiales bacterium]|nr:DUF167 domain-containing protein [Verrucomicrobiales bacterium]
MLTISDNQHGLTVSVHLTPRSSRDKILKIHDGALKIAIQAPPVDNAANDQLVRFLAKTFALPRRDVSIVSGHTGKRKTVTLGGITREQFLRILASLGA